MSDIGERLRKSILRNGLAALSATWRFSESMPEECIDAVKGREPVVIVFWHGSMLPIWYRFRDLDAAAMISASRDGELLDNYLKHIGYRWIVRGSSTRGGSAALADGVGQLATRSLMITPDGPRGPSGHAKPGALIAAMRSHRRILLVGCTFDRAIRTSSWDRMAIPLPFSTVIFRYCFLDSFHSAEDGRISNEEIESMALRLDSLSGASAGSQDESRSEGSAGPTSNRRESHR